MRSVHFTEEHDRFRAEVRRFLESEVAPHAEAWEHAGRIPRQIFRRMGELGFLGILFPEPYGGAGAGLFHAVAFLEELPRSRMGGFCAAVSVQQFMATQHMYRSGSEALRLRYVVPSIAGRAVGALAITEPDTGSDVAAIRTTARRDGDHWVVDGAKTFITNGADGDFYTLAVRTGGDGAAGISLLVVDSDLPGIRVAKRLRKLGWHSSDTAELTFDSVRVPLDRLIGEENSGFYQLMDSFQLERLASAAIAIGSADVALEETFAYLAERSAFGRPLNRFQALRHRLADLATEVEAARQLVYHAAWLHEQGESAIRECSMAKLLATELGMRVADAAVQCFGGYGFMEEFPAARLFRDARGATITAGTSEIMREIIARTLFEEAPAPRPIPPPAPPPRVHVAPPAPAPAPAPDSGVEAVLRSLPARLRPDDAAGWNAVFHLDLLGATESLWTVRIADGRCTVEAGLHGTPDCVVKTREKTFLGIEDGTVNPQTAFLLGKIRISNLSAMMKFVHAFRHR